MGTAGLHARSEHDGGEERSQCQDMRSSENSSEATLFYPAGIRRVMTMTEPRSVCKPFDLSHIVLVDELIEKCEEVVEEAHHLQPIATDCNRLQKRISRR